MDPISLTILTKAIGMLLLICFGGLALYYGFRLYADGKGSGKDSYALEAGPVKLKATSVGSVVMATACIWGLAGVWISPNLDKTGENFKVYSFDTPAGELTSRLIVANATGLDLSDPERLKGLFQEAFAKSEASHPGDVVTLAGVPAAIQSVEASLDTSGSYELSADVQAGQNEASLRFEPQVQGRKVIFVPARSDGEQ